MKRALFLALFLAFGLLAEAQNVRSRDLVGRWKYDTPVMFMESDNVFGFVVNKETNDLLRDHVRPLLKDYGLKPRKFKVRFKDDGTMEAKIFGKKYNCNYAIEGDRLVLSKVGVSLLKLRVYQDGKKLVVGLPVDRFTTVMNLLGRLLEKASPKTKDVADVLTSFKGTLVGISLK